MLSSEAEKKRAEAISFFENCYLKGESYQGKTPQEKRASSKQRALALQEKLYPNSQFERKLFGGISCEIMTGPNTAPNYLIVYLHSGGLKAGSVESGRIFSSFFVEHHCYMSVMPDFRFAPECFYDEILDDCYKAYKAIVNYYKDKIIILAGISSGALLSLSLMQLLIDNQERNYFPNAILIGSPITVLDNNKESNVALKDYDIILRSYDDEQLRAFARDEQQKYGKLLNPIFGTYKNYPPVYIGCGSEERLLDDSVTLFKKIKKEGNAAAYLSIQPGLWHGFWEDTVPETFVELEKIRGFIESCSTKAK